MSNFYEECLDSMVEFVCAKLVLTDPENQINEIRNSFIECLKPLEIQLIQKRVIDNLSIHEYFIGLRGDKNCSYREYFSEITNPSLEELTLFELDQGQEEMNKYLEIIKDLYVEF